MSTMVPKVNGLYTGTVQNKLSYGLKVRLNGFSKHYDGLIDKSQLNGALSDLNIGNLVTVRIVACCDGFISMTTENIQQPEQNIPKTSNNIVQIHKRSKTRVASPDRTMTNQYASSILELSCSNVSVTVKSEEPSFLKNISSIPIPSKIPKDIKIFRDQNSYMAKVAKEKTIGKSARDISLFNFTERDFNTSWTKSTKLSVAFEKLKVSSINEKSSYIDYAIRSKMSIQEQQESLPIYKYQERIIQAVTNNQVLIVIAETGSGKTTQIPQYLLKGGFILHGKIACTQPRRFAAKSVSNRVAQEYGCLLGEEIGYKIRFEDCTGPKTLIKYMTDGILLRECLSDADLQNYSVIMLDEAHERTRDTDVLFGLLKETVKRRKTLKLIISSATLNSEKFSSFFHDAEVLYIPGSMFPVETFYYNIQTMDYFNLALNTVLNIHKNEPAGDILLFLTGQDEIERACDTLEEHVQKNRSSFNLDLVVLPMYSALPDELQRDVLMPAAKGSRKVIVATNIAEVSVTIDGIKYVVDPGYAKQKVNDPKTGLDTLIVIPISQASANQRLGRAGRTSPGKCYRLYTEKAYEEEMLPETVPEIQRSDLTSVVLYLREIGVDNILKFDFMDPPQKDSILASLKQLYLLGALDELGNVTNLGRRMTQLPVDPNLARMLIFSVNLKCTDEIVTIVAMLSVGNIFYHPRKKEKKQEADERHKTFNHVAGDQLRMLNVYQEWERNGCLSDWCMKHYINERKLLEAQETRRNLFAIMEKCKYEIFSAGLNFERIQLAITSGSFQNIAERKSIGLLSITKKNNIFYSTTAGQTVFIHPSSGLFQQLPTWIIFNTLTETSKKYMKELTVINPWWLQAFFPNFYEVKSNNPYSCIDSSEAVKRRYNLNMAN